MLTAQNKPQEGIQLLQTAPNTKHVQRARVYASLRAGRVEEARKLFEALKKSGTTKPSDMASLQNALGAVVDTSVYDGEAALANGDLNGALKLFESARNVSESFDVISVCGY
jgi:Flp pilus assembly protein TadD